MQTATSGQFTAGGGVRHWLAEALPKVVLAPTLLASLIFVYGFIAWTAYLSLTSSRLLPNYDFVGLAQYIALFDNERWWVALKNLGIFGFLFVFLALAIGLTLAILLDQRIRIEGFLRSLYLYPMALSFIVTGAAWKWILNPRVLVYTALIVAAVWFLLPMLVMIVTSIKSLEEIRAGNLLSLPTQISVDAWGKAWGTACIGVHCGGMKGYFWNSVQFVVPAVVLSTLIGALNGYVLSMWRFRGSEVLFSMLLLGCFIPFQVVILPMARTLGWLGIANTTTGLAFVHIVYGLAFTTLFFRNFYVTVPEELVKAARIDGAGFFTIFWRIILPLSVPIITVCVIWQFTQIWNDFLFGVVFSSGEKQPITAALNNLVNTSTGVKEYNVDMAAAIIAALPTLLVYIIAGKYFVRGLTAGAVKG